MKRLEVLENEVATRCGEYERDCSRCPMNDACDVYANARTDIDKIEAMENMIKVSDEYNTILYIYDKSAEEMVTLAKAIRGGANVLEPVKNAFERVLYMRYTERLEAYNIYYGL